MAEPTSYVLRCACGRLVDGPMIPVEPAAAPLSMEGTTADPELGAPSSGETPSEADLLEKVGRAIQDKAGDFDNGHGYSDFINDDEAQALAAAAIAAMPPRFASEEELEYLAGFVDKNWVAIVSRKAAKEIRELRASLSSSRRELEEARAERDRLLAEYEPEPTDAQRADFQRRRLAHNAELAEQARAASDQGER